MIREENFLYSTGWSGAIAAVGGVAAMTLSIAADAPFKAYYLTVSVRQGAAGAELLVVAFAGDIQINDSQVGKNFFNVAGPIDSIAGSGQRPYILTPPRIFAASTSILFTVTSNVATRTQVNVTMHGAKLYDQK